MLSTIDRMVPVIAMSDGCTGASSMVPSSTLMSTPSGRATDRVPFGPLTLISPDWMFTSTPLGRASGFLAIRDMSVSSSGHEAQDFTADALLARLRIGHDALGGGNDGDAQAVEDLRQVALAAVLAQARAREALHVLDDGLAFVVLELDLELALGAVLDHAEVGDVPFILQHAGDGRLHAGRGHLHRRLANCGGIAHAHQHVGDGISHAHDCFPASISERVTRTPCAARARRRAWWPRAACSGRGRTSGRPRGGGRSSRSGWSGGTARSRAAASAASPRPPSSRRSWTTRWR